QALPNDASNGWDAFTHDDLLAVLQGNDQITGYYDIERRKRLAEFGMEPPHGSIDLTYEPSEFLSEFAIRRLQYYEEQRIVIWNQDLGYRYIPVTVRGMKYYRPKIEEQ